MSVSNGPSIVTSGLVFSVDAADRNSYPGSGTLWRDLSGNNNGATLTNGPTFSAANGGVIVFDGTDDYAATASSNIFAFGTGNFTLECWIYPENLSEYLHLLALPNQNIMALKAYLGVVYFYTPTYDTYLQLVNWTLTLNAWNHVSFKRESSVGYAYLNGILIGSKASFTNNFTAQALNIHNGQPGSEFSPCRIASSRIYNTALSNSEVLQNYNATKTRFGL
jgi:hypothetical protein